MNVSDYVGVLPRNLRDRLVTMKKGTAQELQMEALRAEGRADRAESRAIRDDAAAATKRRTLYVQGRATLQQDLKMVGLTPEGAGVKDPAAKEEAKARYAAIMKRYEDYQLTHPDPETPDQVRQTLDRLLIQVNVDNPKATGVFGGFRSPGKKVLAGEVPEGQNWAIPGVPSTEVDGIIKYLETRVPPVPVNAKSITDTWNSSARGKAAQRNK